MRLVTALGLRDIILVRLQYNMNELAIDLCACNSGGHSDLIFSLYE